MLTAGVATTASTGRLIDRFRDRVIFPITHNGQVLGFVGRRNPQTEDDQRIPKYLNTGDTPLFHKGDQLYVTGPIDGTLPVLVEGPMDAIAITVTMPGTHTGVAPLGTSLTEPQAAQLVAMHVEPIIATDADDAGRAAVDRDYWLLAASRGDPRYAELPESSDPASLTEDQRPEVLCAALAEAAPLTFHVIEWATRHGERHLIRATLALAAAAPQHWPRGQALINDRTQVPGALIRSALASAVATWNANPRESLRTATADCGIHERDDPMHETQGFAPEASHHVAPLRQRRSPVQRRPYRATPPNFD